MSNGANAPDDPPPLPAARVRRRRWRLSAVWIVPVVAAIVAGYLVRDRLREVGPTITITFGDADGVKPDQTEVHYRGVRIGQVTSTTLSEDTKHAVVKVRLQRSAESIAREGSVFWIVRPEVGIAQIRGLATVLTGPYIELIPGTGKRAREFRGLDQAPLTLGRRGLEIILEAAQLGSVRVNSPILYRGVEVGTVTSVGLSRDAGAAQIHALVDQRFARLVRSGSRFWNVSGLDVDVGLFKGVQISIESLKALVGGGIAFATPEDPGTPVKDGTVFPVHDKPQDEWLRWRPKIPVSGAASASRPTDTVTPTLPPVTSPRRRRRAPPADRRPSPRGGDRDRGARPPRRR